jgi:MFS family permease
MPVRFPFVNRRHQPRPRIVTGSFRLLFLARGVSVFGDYFVNVALAFAILDLTGSASDLSAVLAAEAAAMIAGLLVGGVYADRLPRRTIMVGADLLRATVEVTAAFLLLTHTHQFWPFPVLFAVYGVGSGFFNPALTGLVAETAPREDLQRANATLGLATSVGAIAGPVLAGLLVAGPGAGVAFALDAATFVASAALLAAIPQTTTRAVAQTFFADLREGWDDFRSRTWLWLKVVHWTFFLLFAYAPLFVWGPLVAKRDLGGAIAWGVISTAFAIGAVAGRIVAQHLTPARPVLTCFALTLAAVPSLLLLAAAAPYPLIALTHAVMGAAFAYYGSVFAAVMQRSIPLERLSRASSYEWLGSMALMPLGFAIAGPLESAIGLRASLLLAALWTTISTIAVIALPAVRLFRWPEDTAPPS